MTTAIRILTVGVAALSWARAASAGDIGYVGRMPSAACAPVPALFTDAIICLPSESSANLSTGAHGADGFPAPHEKPQVGAWVQGGDSCYPPRPGYGDPNERFCAFVNAALGGRGLSLIVSADRLAKLSARPAFTDILPEGPGSRASAPSESEAPPPYRVADVPSKGTGLVATGAIRAGDVVMVRTPAVMVDERALGILDHDHLIDLLGAAVGNLPAAHRAEVLSLSTENGRPSAGTHGEHTYRILATNAFRTPVDDGGRDFHSVFTSGRCQRLVPIGLPDIYQDVLNSH